MKPSLSNTVLEKQYEAFNFLSELGSKVTPVAIVIIHSTNAKNPPFAMNCMSLKEAREFRLSIKNSQDFYGYDVDILNVKKPSKRLVNKLNKKRTEK